MVVVLRKESDLSAKWRSLILAIMLCSSIVVAGWAAYLVGEDASGQLEIKDSPRLAMRIDLNSTSRFLLSDDNGTAEELQVRELPLSDERNGTSFTSQQDRLGIRSPRADLDDQVALALPRAELSGLPGPPQPVPLELSAPSTAPEPTTSSLPLLRPDRTREMAESLKQKMKLGRVQVQAARGFQAGITSSRAVIPAGYQQESPVDRPAKDPLPGIFTVLARQLPSIEIPGLDLLVPAGVESPLRRSASPPYLPWRLAPGRGN